STGGCSARQGRTLRLLDGLRRGFGGTARISRRTASVQTIRPRECRGRRAAAFQAVRAAPVLALVPVGPPFAVGGSSGHECVHVGKAEHGAPRVVAAHCAGPRRGFLRPVLPVASAVHSSAAVVDRTSRHVRIPWIEGRDNAATPRAVAPGGSKSESAALYSLM